MWFSWLFSNSQRFGFRTVSLVLCAFAAGLFASTAWAQAPAQAAQRHALPSIFATNQTLGLPEPLRVLNTPRGSSLTPEVLSKDPLNSQFVSWKLGMALATSPTQNVWLRLIIPATSEPQSWVLRIPRMSVEKATFYSADSISGGGWKKVNAGTNLPRNQWPMPTRDPAFEITTQANQTQLFFIELEHASNITENVELIRNHDVQDAAHRLGTLNGLIIGIFGILTLGSLISAWIHRSAHFGWLALLCFAILLAQLTLTGYASMRIWPNNVFLTQAMAWVMPLFGLGAFARFALSVTFAKDLSKPIYFGLWALVAACALFCGLVMLLPQSVWSAWVNPFFALGSLSVMASMIWIGWRSQHWLWMVVLSFAPVVVSIMHRLAYNLGWVAQAELVLLTGAITSGLGLLAVFTSLYLYQKQLLAISYREKALDDRDASTGLFTEHIARRRLPQLILRSKRFNRSCGVILLRWLDFKHVTSNISARERERILYHLGNRLQRLAREIDTVARVGDDQFVFLVEAPITREDINALASKILTTCLRPSAALGDLKGFDLNLAVWLSSDVMANADQVFELLNTRINQMREGTQRRVQFVDTPLTTGSDSIKDQAAHAAKLVEKINALEATQGLPSIALKPRKPSNP
jgi:two-component system, sensor histidine kinase LadS